MGKWALLFLMVTIVSAVLGYGGVIVMGASVARLSFNVFLVAFLVLITAGYLRGGF